jgi:poly(A) polymerase
MKQGVPQGPALGAAIAAAEQAWIAAGFPADQAALEAIVAKAAHP